MKKIQLLILWLCMGLFSIPTIATAQNTLTVADGTDINEYVPIYGWYADYYLRSQVIYPANILSSMTGGTLSSMTFYLSEMPTTQLANNFDVKLMEVSASSFSSQDFLNTATATTVYTGTVTYANSQMTITFSTPFLYQGGNLLLDISTASSATDYGRTYYLGVTATNASLQGYNSNSVANISGTYRNFIPKTTFAYSGGATCLAPQNPVISNETISSADFSWTPRVAGLNYEVYIVPQGTTVDWNNVTWTLCNTDTSYTFSNLNPLTDYTAYVRTDCGGGDYSAPFAVNFRTLADCSNITIPYTENFDSYTTSATGATPPAGFPNVEFPNCWAFLNNSTTTSTYPLMFLTSYSSYAVFGNCLFFKSSQNTPAYAVLPAFTEYIHNLQLSFTYRNEGTDNSNGTLHVGYMTDPVNPATYVDVYTCPKNTTKTEVEVRFDTISASAGNNYHIAFKYVGGTSDNYYLGLDNVSVSMIPSCPKPSDLTVNGTTSTSVTLSWTETGSATSWNVAYGDVGFNPDTAMVNVEIVGTTPSTTIGNLTSGTTYEFYVQADCGGMTSEWRGPLTVLPGVVNMGVTGHDTLTSCGTIICDNGGATNYYSSNCNAYMVIYPDQPGAYVRISGTLSTELNYDYLRVYDGDSISATYVQYTGPNQTVDVNSTTGPLTLYFHSDSGIENDGFVLTVSCISCVSPTLTVASPGVNSVSLSWSDYEGTATDFEIAYGPTGFDPDTATAIFVAGATSYTISGLAANTFYDACIRSDCGGGDMGLWTRVSFLTLAGMPATIPYNCGFEDNVENTAWTILNGTDANQWFIGDAVHNSGSNALYISSSATGATNDYDMTFSSNVWAYRDIQFGNGTAYMLSFDWRGVGESCCDYIQVYLGNPTGVTAGSNTPPANAVLIGKFNNETTWQSFNGVLDGSIYANTTKRLYFLWHNDGSLGTNPAGAIDNLSVETIECFYPTVSITSSTMTGVTVSIDPASPTDAQWELRLNDGTSVVVNDTTYTFNNLSLGLTYTVMARTICGSGDTSIWSTPVTFSTACAAVAIPFSENFDSYPPGTNNYLNCWSRSNDYSTYYSYPYLSSSHALSGNVSLYFYSSGTTYSMAVTPEIDLTTYSMNQLQVRFSMYNNNHLSAGMIVGVMTDPTDLSTFVGVDTVFTTALYSHQWMEVPLIEYNGPGAYVALKYYNPYDNGAIYLDDFSITEIPDCPRSQDLTCTNYTNSTATLSWTEQGTASEWLIEYGLPGFVPGAGTVVLANSNPFTMTGLTSGTNYKFYVRSICSLTDTSDYSNPVTIHTLCDAVTLTDATQYMESFEGELGCWTSQTIGNTTIDWEITTYNAYFGLYNAYLSYDYSHAYLISPVFDMSAMTGTPTLVFAHSQPSYMGIHDEMKVYYRTSETDTWHQLAHYTASINTFVEDTFQLPSPSATYQIAFEGIGQNGDGVYLDKVQIFNIGAPVVIDPTVVTAAATNITETSATLHGTVTAGSETITAQGFEWKATTGGTYTVVNATGATMSCNLTGLTPNTGYTFRAFATTASGTFYGSEMTFTTDQEQQETCPAPTNVMQAIMCKTPTAHIYWIQEEGDANEWKFFYKKVSESVWDSVITTTPDVDLILEDSVLYEGYVVTHCTNGLWSDPSDTITFQADHSGINDYTLDNSVIVYPNPTNGMVQIQNTEFLIQNVEVYDTYGKMLNVVNVNGNTAAIDLTGYAAGTYFVRVMTDRGVVTKRVVKQ